MGQPARRGVAAATLAVAKCLRVIGLVAIVAGWSAGAFAAKAVGPTPTGILTDTISLISGDGQAGPTGSAGSPIVVEVRSPQGQPIAGRTIQWTTTGHVLATTSSITDATGRASVAFTIGSIPGAFTITATDATSAFSAAATVTGTGQSSIVIVSGNRQSVRLGTHSVQPFVVEVRDSTGNPIAGRSITWTDNSGGSVVVDAASSVTDAAGRASMGFNFVSVPVVANPVEARDPIRAASVFFNVVATGSDTLTMVSGLRHVGPVGSHSTEDIVVEVRDALGNPIAGRTIDWDDPAGTMFTLDAPTSLTDASGQASMGFTYLPPSIGCVSCSITATDGVTSITVAATALGVGADTLTLVSGVYQDGPIGSHSTQDVVVEVRDAIGNPIAGRTVDWTDVTGGRFTVDAATSVTDAAGQARMGFTFLAPSTGCGLAGCQIQAQDQVTALTVSATATGIGSESFVVVSGQNQRGPVGSHSTQDIVVEVRDPLGNPIVGRTINWNDPAGTMFTLDAATSVTDAAGQARMGFTFLTQTCTCPIDALDPVSTLTVSVNATGIGADKVTLVSGQNQNGAVGSHSAQDIVVEVRDALGTPLAGRTILWSDVTGGMFTMDAPTSVTNTGGQASMGFTYLAPSATCAGACDIRAMDQVTSNFVETPADGVGTETLTIVQGHNQNGPIGGDNLVDIIVELRDALGNPIPGRTIDWTDVNGGLFAMNAPTSVTDAVGRASMGWTYLAASAACPCPIEAQDAAGGHVVTANATPVNQDTLTIVSGDHQNAAVGAHSAVDLVVQVLDTANVPVVGRTINWNDAFSTVTFDAPTSVTDALGQAAMGFTVQPVGSNVVGLLTASDAVTGQSVGFRFFGVKDTLTVVSPAFQYGAPGAVAQPAVVELLDGAGTPIAGRTVLWTVTGDALVSGPASVTNGLGRATMNAQFGPTLNNSQINAQDAVTGEQIVAGSLVLVGTDQVTISSTTELSGAPGAPSVFPAAVEVRNSAGAPMLGRTVNWTVVAGDAVLDAPSSVVDPSGEASIGFTFGTVDSQIQATESGGSSVCCIVARVSPAESLRLVSGSGQAGTVGSASAAPLVVEVLDTSGAPVAGRAINWTSGSGLVVPSSAVTVTNGVGQASVTLNFVTLGQDTLTAFDATSGNAVAAFASATGHESLILVSGNGQSGTNGSAGAAPLVVEWRDGAGNPIIGGTVNWVGGGGASATAPTSLTNGAGQASMTFTFGPTHGTHFVTASIASGQAVNFQLASTTLDVMTIVSGDQQFGGVGAASAAPMVVQIVNGVGNPVVGATVSWSSTCGASATCAQPAGATNTTDALGQASMAFTHGTSPGVHQITASSGNESLRFTITDAGSETLSLFSGNGQTGTVGAAGAAPMVVELIDSSGFPVVGAPISWLSPCGATPTCAQPTAATSNTDAAGRASMNYTYGTSGGVNQMGAFTASGASVHFTLSATGSETLTLLSGNGQSGPLGTAGAAPLVIELLDVAGAPVVGATINWASSCGASPACAQPVAATSTTDALGQASMGFTYGTNAFAHSIFASAGSQSVHFSVTSSGASNLTLISGNGQTGTVGTAGAAPLVIELRDAANAPVAGATVAWASNCGVTPVCPQPAATSSTTDAFGQSSMTFTYGTDSAMQVINAAAGGQTVTFAITSSGGETLTLVSGNGQTGAVGTAGAAPMVVQLLDAAGSPLVGATVSWNSNCGLPPGCNQPLAATNVTDATGTASMGFVYGTSTTVQGIVAGAGAQTLLFTLTPTGGESMTLISGNGQFGAFGAPGGAPLVVEVRDSSGVPVVGRTINWLGGGVGTATPATATNATDATGRASMNFTHGSTSATSVITASDAVSLRSVEFDISSSGDDTLTLVSGNGQSGDDGTTAGAPIVVEAHDAAGNPIVGRTINWTGNNTAVVAAASSTTGATGQATMPFDYAGVGPGDVVAVDAVTGESLTANVLALQPGEQLGTVTGSGQSGGVGTPGALLKVRLLDGLGNPIVGRGITWSQLGASDLVFTSAATTTTDALGEAILSFDYGTAGTNIVRATEMAFGRTTDFTVVALPGAATLAIVSGDGQTTTVGNAFPLPLVVNADNGGVPAPGLGIDWAVTSGSAILSVTSTTTDLNGDTSNALTAGPVSGPVVVTATRADDGSVIATFNADVDALVMSLAPTSGDAQSAATGAPFAAPLVVLAEDDGVAVAGVTIDWLVTSGDAVVAAATSVTDGTGSAAMTMTAGPTAGPVTVTATRQDNTAAIVTFNATVTAVPALSIASGDAQSANASAAFALPLVVLADDSGVPAAGITIDWLVTSGSAVVATATSTTDAAGNATMTLTAGAVAGPVTVSATRQDAPTETVTFNANVLAIPTLSVASGDAQSAPASTAFAQPLVVLADDSGVPAAGVTIDWLVTSGDATVAAATSVTDAAGNATMTLTAGVLPGGVTVTATRQDAPTAIATFTASVTAVPSLTLVSGDAQSAIGNTAFALPLVVIAEDSGVAMPGITIDWLVTSGAATLGAATSITDAAGNATMTLTAGALAGPVTITATRQDAPTQTVAFTATVTAVPTLGIVSGDAQSATVSTAFGQPLVVLADDGGVPAAGVTITWAIGASPGGTAPTLGSGTAVTDASGLAQVTLTAGDTAGAIAVTAQRQDFPAATVTFNATASPVVVGGTLTRISGGDESLPTNTPSAPLVVELRDLAGLPVAGATISWVGTNATPSAANTATDANGRTSVTATVTQAGPATVEAGAVGIAGPTFALNGGVAALPGLTEEEAAVATAIDTLCPALAALANPTPEQQDLLARCTEILDAAGLDPDATIVALQEMLSESARVQATAAITAAVTQMQNIRARLAALRSGSTTSSLGGLTLVGPGGAVSLGDLTTALLGEGDQEIGADFDRWGFFATGSLGRGEADASGGTPTYDYDVNGITAGVDYRYRDNLLFGAALGFSKQDTDVADDEGSVEMTGWNVSAYATYSFKESWYVDGVATWGRNDFDIGRRVGYTLPLQGGGTVEIDQTATGSPSGDLLEFALTFGGDFYKDAWTFGPYARLTHTRMGFEAYAEEMESGPGSGLALQVDARDVNAFTGVLGGRIGYSHSAEWGVLVPTASLEWEREFKGDLQSLSARFLHDPTQTPIVITNDPLDNQYFRIGLGLSLVMTGGRSGFLLYERVVARDGMAQENISLGIRIEF